MKTLLCYIIIFFISINFSKGAVHICEQGKTKSLKEILKSAAPHDTILLRKGIYRVMDLIIDKPVTILGEGNAVIDGQRSANIFIIKSDFVNLVGLHLKNSGSSSSVDYSGIRIENGNKCRIENNILADTFFGIYLSGSSDCTIRNNKLASRAERESFSGNGIHIWKSDNINIVQNEISGHRDGIYFEFVTNSKIIENYSRKNLRYGLHFMFSNGNSYISNIFEKNGAGVAVMYTKNITMKNNRFIDNWGPASYGLLLKDISDSEISGNYFNKNTVAIFMEGSIRIELKKNVFTNNGWALKMLGNCYENKLSYNNFTGNTFDFMTNSTGNRNILNFNYWDKYTGYDLDKNYIGDVPFWPVSSFAKMTETTPSAVILLRSFMVELFDKLERLLPSLYAVNIVDNQPLMQPVKGIIK